MAVDAGTIYSEVRIELDKLRGDIKNMNTQFNKFAKSNDKQATKVQKSWKDKFKKINLAGVAAFAGIGMAVKKAISTFSDFEQSMANVQSVARATPEEFQKLENAAQSAGETTKFTASQAADSLYALASAGLTATESAEALDGVLKLAGATQSDLASTAAAVTSTLSQYGLEASEATDVSNVFAAAIANSQANMGKLTSALRQAGPVAGTLGISLEETTGALQALFDAGIKGEQAGTALRNILSRLANEADPTVKKLEKLGLSFEELNPQVNDLTEIIGTLEDANLSAGQAIDAFGQEAGPQMLSLLRVGKKGIEDYTDAVTDTDAAAEAYGIQMNTVQGSIAELQSAIEAGAISFVKEFEPALRKILDVLKTFARFVGDLPGPIKIFIGVLAALTVGIGAAATAATVLSGALGVLLGPVGLVIAGVAGIAAGVAAIKGAVDKAKINDIKDRFGDLAAEIGTTDEKLVELVESVELLGTKGDDNIESVIKKLKKFQEETGISDDKLNELVKTAEVLGATDENIGSMVEKAHALTTEFGLTKEQIFDIQYGLTMGDSMRDIKEQVSRVADQLSLTEKEVLKVAAASEEITPEYKEQLETLLEQIEGQERTQEMQARLYGRQVDELHEMEKIEVKRIEKVEERLEKEKEVTEEKKKQLTISETLSPILDWETETAKKAIGWNERLVDLGRAKANLETASADKLEDYKSNLELILGFSKEELELNESKENILDAIEKTEAMIGIQRRIVANADEESKDAAVKRLAFLGKTIEVLEKISSEFEDQGDELTDISDKTEDFRSQIVNLTSNEFELLQLERQRAIENAKASGASEEAIEEQIGLINELFKVKVKQSDIEDKIIRAAKERALVEAEMNGASQKELGKINESYELLIEKVEEYKQTNKVTNEDGLEQLREINEATLNVHGTIDGIIDSLTTGDIQTAIADIGDAFDDLSKSAESAEAAAALAILGVVAQVTAATISFFEKREERAKKYQRTLNSLEDDIASQRLANQKTLLDKEYQAEIENIEKIRDDRVKINRDMLETETEDLLESLGILQQSTEDRYDDMYDNILEKAKENGVKLSTSEKTRIQNILDEQEEAEKAKAEAEKKYKQDLAQYDYDKAVFDKELAISQAKINKEKAISELSWWDINVYQRDDDINSQFDDLISAMETQPLPPEPSFATGGFVIPKNSERMSSFQTGGIVVPSGPDGTSVRVAENGSPEMLLNAGAEGAALLDEFATRIANAMGAGNDRGTPIKISISLDGKPIAENSAKYYNNGQVALL